MQESVCLFVCLPAVSGFADFPHRQQGLLRILPLLELMELLELLFAGRWHTFFRSLAGGACNLSLS